MSGRPGLVPATYVGGWRSVVLVVALAATALKLGVAGSTFGTNDVHSWIDFAQGIRDHGLIDVYGREYFTQYNHPPLAGLILLGVNWLVDAGVADVPFLIRVPASVADVVTSLVLFELIRRRRSVRQAAVAGILVSISPALITISGFHGNTDPVFVMFVLLAVYFTVAKRWAFVGGIAIAAALSVKLVPVVVVPVLLVVVLRAGWRMLLSFTAGGLAVFAPLWGPVLLGAWPQFSENVLFYAGVFLREWGLPQFMDWAGAPVEQIDLLTGSGRFVVLVISAVVPAMLAWWRPHAADVAVGLSLALFLLLSPAFGMQYLVWPLAAAYLIGNGVATAYNAAASAYILTVYSNWNGAGIDQIPRPPWQWYEGVAVQARDQDLVYMVVTWAALLAVVLGGLWRIVRDRPARAVPAPPDAADPAVPPEPAVPPDGASSDPMPEPATPIGSDEAMRPAPRTPAPKPPAPARA